MIILLDLDGVLITTPAWRAVEQHADGFLQFNAQATANLAHLLRETGAAILLTTSHRINYSLAEWAAFLRTRGLVPAALSKVDERTSLWPASTRAAEITAWVSQHGAAENYVILDDDLSLHSLPPALKNRWVPTKPLIGLDDAATQQAFTILQENQH
ncbi:HAD domain-containing protein [Hymenobacter sp. H14-R3]|uniref:HAD domain-containing protein n=1 Tax=Hymenobacter sp. H14-R3 TaxID=3046308 RepID=UPI0024B9DDB3|nr:HAD domain-containing protein [Hymenobacter sp. H14-R3]MDJ0365831.1 HAD domain-containing protein [Hymenobacter sp. H14-R3]